MSAATMSNGAPVTAEHDARLLSGLRERRARRTTSTNSLTITVDELDMLFRRVDELTTIKRLMCSVGGGE